MENYSICFWQIKIIFNVPLMQEGIDRIVNEFNEITPKG